MATSTMSRRKQVLVIEPPEELFFTGPGNIEIFSNIRLTNPSEGKVCFEVKTTAPSKYSVMPAFGLVEPQGEVQVTVGLKPSQPREVGPDTFLKPFEMTRDKFQVQSILMLEGREQGFDRQCMERPAEVMFTKLRSVINLTDDNPEEVVFLTNDYSAEGIALVNDTVPEMARVEDLEVAEAESKAFTDVLAPDLSDVKQALGGDREVKGLKEEVAEVSRENKALQQEVAGLLEVSRETGALQQEVDRLTQEARGGKDSLLSLTYLYLGFVLLLVGVVCGKNFLG